MLHIRSDEPQPVNRVTQELSRSFSIRRHISVDEQAPVSWQLKSIVFFCKDSFGLYQNMLHIVDYWITCVISIRNYGCKTKTCGSTKLQIKFGGEKI